MRLVLAALFVFAGLLGLVVLFDRLGWLDAPGLLGSAAFVVAPLVLLGAAWALFNKRPWPSGPTQAQQVAALAAAGLLVESEFQARRAFQVDEFEDEGLSFFLELVDGAVLFLSGQYLYEFADCEPRRFPCERFTLLRHATAGYVADLRCAGRVLEPEAVAPPFTTEEHRAGVVPENGQLLRERGYDELKATMLRRRSA